MGRAAERDMPQSRVGRWRGEGPALLSFAAPLYCLKAPTYQIHGFLLVTTGQRASRPGKRRLRDHVPRYSYSPRDSSTSKGRGNSLAGDEAKSYAEPNYTISRSPAALRKQQSCMLLSDFLTPHCSSDSMGFSVKVHRAQEDTRQGILYIPI